MSALLKACETQAPFPHILPQIPRSRRLNRSTIADNHFLLDEKNFVKYNKIIKNYVRKKENQYYWAIAQNVKNGVFNYVRHFTIHEYIEQLLKAGRLPHDYQQRHTLRLLAQGVQVPQSQLEQLGITFFDGSPSVVSRLAKQDRQTKSPFDYVLIDPAKWGEYEPLQRFYEGLPEKPYASFDKDGNARILPKSKAINLPYIQPNHPLYVHCIVFDVDEQAGRCAWTAWQYDNLPPPNIIVKNPVKDSCHYIYLLALPIGKGGKSSKKPIVKLDHIYKEMRERLGADPCYAGNRMKNPLSRLHDCFVSGAKPYTLEQLAERLDFPELEDLPKFQPAKRTSKPIEAIGYLGRNHAIFDNIRWIGYKNAHNMGFDSLRYLLLCECEKYNQANFSNDPLPANELWHIANSIARFCKSERFSKYSEGFIERQRADGRKGALVANAQGANSKGGLARSKGYDDQRTQAHAMHLQGVSKAQIAVTLGISRRTIINWLKE